MTESLLIIFQWCSINALKGFGYRSNAEIYVDVTFVVVGIHTGRYLSFGPKVIMLGSTDHECQEANIPPTTSGLWALRLFPLFEWTGWWIIGDFGQFPCPIRFRCGRLRGTFPTRNSRVPGYADGQESLSVSANVSLFSNTWRSQLAVSSSFLKESYGISISTVLRETSFYAQCQYIEREMTASADSWESTIGPREETEYLSVRDK